MIIDSHFHLGMSPGFHYYETSIERYLQYMEKRNISYCMNIHSIGLLTDEMERGLEEDMEAYKLSSGKILSYYVFNPNYADKSLKLMERYKDRSIFKAIKLHPSFHGVYADDGRYEAAWEYAAANDLPIMSHTWAISPTNDAQKFSYPPLFEKYIARYPQVNLICGHSGGRYDGIQQAVRMASRYPNVYMDTAGDVYANGLISFLVKGAGADRVLFGSDGFWMDARTQIGMILAADISLEDKKKILFENAMRLFRING
ncbi:amidohydrolase family protein [Cohnella silvisoli]|uniref:Amidohydrolase family protein n=1 Tax=Cohnella silvisoli TaxID=2873699 RepID=A0ABV1KMW5_9BACL|nr:amidohydrolase family protein [Cohnella silvisoli]MCD9020264.1 amidohydrolase family protein [Cohnella silvisoli]